MPGRIFNGIRTGNSPRGSSTYPLAESCNTVGCPFVEGLKAKFPGVFSSVGRLKNYQLKLNIEPQVTPVVQKMRRISFSLKDKVTAKLMNSLRTTSLKEWKGL